MVLFGDCGAVTYGLWLLILLPVLYWICYSMGAVRKLRRCTCNKSLDLRDIAWAIWGLQGNDRKVGF